MSSGPSFLQSIEGEAASLAAGVKSLVVGEFAVDRTGHSPVGKALLQAQAGLAELIKALVTEPGLVVGLAASLYVLLKK